MCTPVLQAHIAVGAGGLGVCAEDPDWTPPASNSSSDQEAEDETPSQEVTFSLELAHLLDSVSQEEELERLDS